MKRLRLNGAWRLLIGLAMALALVTGTLATWQMRVSQQEESRLRPTTAWVKVNGFSLYYRCIGSGSPTVILEAAFTATSDEWAWVMPEIARVTRVCAYDRAGLGWSEESQQPHDALHIARQLDLLLQRAQIPGPYLLAGHSMGGLFIREYAGLYPDKIAGLVAIDPVAPGELERLPRPAAAGYYRLYRFTSIAPDLARLGLLRLRNPFLRQAAGLPGHSVAAFRHFFNSPQHLAAMRAELQQWYVTGQEVRQASVQPDLPLLVIGAGLTENRDPAVAAVQQQMHQQLAAMSRKGRYLLIPGARHATLVTEAAQAQLTSQSIIQMVRQVRAMASAH